MTIRKEVVGGEAYRQPRLALDAPQKPKQTDMLEGA